MFNFYRIERMDHSYSFINFETQKITIQRYDRNYETLLTALQKIGALLALLRVGIFIKYYHMNQFENKIT